MIKRVAVVQKPGMAKVFIGRKPIAGNVPPVERQYFEASAPEIRLQDKAVATGAQDDASYV